MRWLFLFFCLTLVSWLLPTRSFASAYGVSSYGGGQYNVGANTESAAQATSTSSPSHPGCSAQKPGSAPDLFQINPSITSVKLFFTPVANPRDRYYISYGLSENSEQYGAEITNDSNGVIAVEVRSLAANSRYYFKVRGGNDCQPGDWSNTLPAKTGQRFPTYHWFALPRVVVSEVAKRVQSLTSDDAVTKTPIALPQSEPTPVGGLPTPTINPTSTPQLPLSPSTAIPESKAPTFWGRITHFFKELFAR